MDPQNLDDAYWTLEFPIYDRTVSLSQMSHRPTGSGTQDILHGDAQGPIFKGRIRPMSSKTHLLPVVLTETYSRVKNDSDFILRLEIVSIVTD